MSDVCLPKYPLKNFSVYVISSHGNPEGDIPGAGIPGCPVYSTLPISFPPDDHLTYCSTYTLSILYIACEWRYLCGLACLHNVQCLSMLLHRSIPRLFVWPSTIIPLYPLAVLFPCMLIDTCFPLLAFTIKVLWAFIYGFLCWHMFSVLLGTYLEVELLSHMVPSAFNLLRSHPPVCFPFPPAMRRIPASQCPHYSSFTRVCVIHHRALESGRILMTCFNDYTCFCKAGSVLWMEKIKVKKKMWYFHSSSLSTVQSNRYTGCGD